MEMVPRVESWFGHLDRIDARRIVISWNAQAKIVAIMSHEFVWTAHSIIAISVNMLKVELDSETFDARRFRGLNHIPISLQKVHRSDHARRIHFYAQCCLCWSIPHKAESSEQSDAPAAPKGAPETQSVL